jgi:hypothetical protein
MAIQMLDKIFKPRRIAPRLVTEAGFKADESVAGIAIMAYGKRRMPKRTIKAEGVYGQNLHHLTMLGGYAVERVADPVRRTQEYAPLDTVSFWPRRTRTAPGGRRVCSAVTPGTPAPVTS